MCAKKKLSQVEYLLDFVKLYNFSHNLGKLLKIKVIFNQPHLHHSKIKLLNIENQKKVLFKEIALFSHLASQKFRTMNN